MPAQYFSADSRGKADHDWLKTRFSYSFAHYYDPSRMGFGALRVVNDDWIAPGAGFPTHPHQNMEIITIPLTGKLAHKDDSGGEGVVEAGMVQVMSAGTGVFHSEFNASKEVLAELFQIWIEPDQYHVAPRYLETAYAFDDTKTGMITLAGPEGLAPAWIHQDAFISRVSVLPGENFQYTLQNQDENRGVYLLVIQGAGEILAHTLSKRDALEISGEKSFEILAKTKMDILSIEVPLT